MTSDEMNKRIVELVDDYGDPVVPYFGWFWRTVDFDADRCTLGVANGEVRFMESNKWDYDEVVCDGDNWVKLKELLRAAIEKKTPAEYMALHEFMQSLEGLPRIVYG